MRMLSAESSSRGFGCVLKTEVVSATEKADVAESLTTVEDLIRR